MPLLTEDRMIFFDTNTVAETLNAFQRTGQRPKLPLPAGDFDPHLIHG